MSTQNVENVLSASQQMALIEANVAPADFEAVQAATASLPPTAPFDAVAAFKLGQYTQRGYSVSVTVTTPA
jgi:hypothetical protein